MRLGIDFGTTRIVVAAVDRGNYPVVCFDTPQGEPREWFPSLVAVRRSELLFGWDAWHAQEDPDATIVRSLKRHLQDAGPLTRVEIAGQAFPMLDLLTGLCAALRLALLHKSSLRTSEGDPIEVHLGVPANANGNQRFLTVEAFQRAGFRVLGLLNEPSAASVEYGHGLRVARNGKPKDRVLVYDLGGGTFDASLVDVEAGRHVVLASEGIPSLGGDDFDDVLADLAFEGAGIGPDDQASLTQAEWFRLYEECRLRKESLHPNTRKLSVDLEAAREGWPTVVIPVADFYRRAQPLVDETLNAVADLIASSDREVECLYVTGGASDLPIIARELRDRYGRRVRRSSYPHSATAIGLAIQSDADAGYLLRERFTRNFGVWREAEGGRTIIFDPLFLKGTPLPGENEPPLAVGRTYYAAHNIGHFRYLECSHTTPEGRPAGEITVWDDILFPFDPALSQVPSLANIPVTRYDWGPAHEIEEQYRCDAGGAVTVTIFNRTAGYHRVYRLGRWAVPEAPLVPGRKRARRAPRKS